MKDFLISQPSYVLELPDARFLGRYRLVFCPLLILLVCFGASACHPGMMDQMLNPRPDGEFHYDCSPRGDDPEGYVVAVCEYLNEHQIWAGNGAPYGIDEIIESEQESRMVITILFNCCGTGDMAVIDKETGEVLGYSVGIW